MSAPDVDSEQAERMEEVVSSLLSIADLMIGEWDKHARGKNRLYTEIGDGGWSVQGVEEGEEDARKVAYATFIKELQESCPGVVVKVNDSSADETNCDVRIEDADDQVEVYVYHLHKEHAPDDINCLCRACIDGFQGSGMMHAWAEMH